VFQLALTPAVVPICEQEREAGPRVFGLVLGLAAPVVTEMAAGAVWIPSLSTA